MAAKSLRVAIEGCCHGELDRIYNALLTREETEKKKIDLLLICGDFQAMRNPSDLLFMCCPDKYKRLGGFYRYYSGEKVAPIPTIFIGGNHEASNYNRELYLGGWVAPNIYFLGLSNIIWFKGLRIAGLSGIHNEHTASYGYHENPPFMPIDRFKSLYHTRTLECLKFLQLQNSFAETAPSATNDDPTHSLAKSTKRIDIFLSHDWPSSVPSLGNLNYLLSKKPYFKKDISTGKLGSDNLNPILNQIKPRFWFSAHLHVRYLVDIDWNLVEKKQAVVSSNEKNQDEINLDDFLDSDSDIESKDWAIPQNFEKTAPAALPKTNPHTGPNFAKFFNFFDNPQTSSLCEKFGLEDIFAKKK
ncbi:hypothetical protein BB560_004039 [Smittium megazygosporum]|uniref:Lariat debranching enzyme C-terminal domain-containing protein n=1 Tax=Smittium megazygosporum TaxID=133381 RepID=A0A2T9ZAB7_9FUNG|nr:hypothetical protein BB560_004039 [Smittium megazygosporum]